MVQDPIGSSQENGKGGRRKAEGRRQTRADKTVRHCGEGQAVSSAFCVGPSSACLAAFSVPPSAFCLLPCCLARTAPISTRPDNRRSQAAQPRRPFGRTE